MRFFGGFALIVLTSPQLIAEANGSAAPDGDQACSAFETHKLAADGAAAGDRFGHSVALSGEVAVVGVPGDDTLASDAGSAYVYRLDGGAWLRETQLTAADGVALDHFGQAVAASGDVVIVGAPDGDGVQLGTGLAYVYRLDEGTWLLEAKLMPADGLAGDKFGDYVAVLGDVALVGAPSAGGSAGAVYVFRFDGSHWVPGGKLVPLDSTAGDQFGRSIALRGQTALIAAPFDDDRGTDSGAVYVYRWVGDVWTQEGKLTASDAAAQDRFGRSVALSDDLAVIGSPEDDDRGSNSGSVYLFGYDGSAWVQAAKFTAADGAAGDRFGDAVAANDQAIAVGAPGDDDGALNTGSVYLYYFSQSAWAPLAKVGASDRAAGDAFGWPVALGGEVCLVGAWQDDDGGFSSGSAFAFHGVADCNGNGGLDLCDLGNGSSEDLNGNHVPDECDPDCNGNGVPDDLDIRWQTSADCNGNRVPDECDIAAGVSGDCNENGVPDECDIASGTSGDCDGNGVPDSCEGDGDGDGVPDPCDRCPDTPPGVPVGGDGCPLSDDSDGDGVPDDQDWCPDTPQGLPVDEHGCATGQLVDVCHVPGRNADNRHVIHVAPSAVPAHLAHGDSLGPCDGTDDPPPRGEGGDGKHGDHSDGSQRTEEGEDETGGSASPTDKNAVLQELPLSACGAGAAGFLPLALLALALVKRDYLASWRG